MRNKHSQNKSKMLDWIEHVENLVVRSSIYKFQGISYAHFRHYDKNTGFPRGAVTVAYALEKIKPGEEQYKIRYAVSCCSPQDTWNRTEARLRAIRRLYAFEHNLCGSATLEAAHKKEAERKAYAIVITKLVVKLGKLSWFNGISWFRNKDLTFVPGTDLYLEEGVKQ